MKKYSLIIIIIVTFSCTEKPVEFGGIKSFKIDKFDSNLLQCKAEIEIVNNSYFPINLETGELHAFTDNTDLGVVKLLQPLRIAGDSKQTYFLNFTVEITNPEAGMASLLDRLTGKKPVYCLRGTLHARSFLVHKEISINEVLGK
jgi:hypothetical protein